MKNSGFNLIELLLVVAIMGLMGTAAVGGYRAMQRGMEERGVMQNVNQFIRAAYQRAQMDRSPVDVYFWNETLRTETDFDTPIVVGKAVAVRRAGRISEVQGNDLYDEFGDLRFQRFVQDEEISGPGNEASSEEEEDLGIFLYNMREQKRCTVSQNAVRQEFNVHLLSCSDLAPIEAYAFRVIESNGVNWKRGDGYGFEFAEIQLPHNYIFESSFSSTTSSPVEEIKTMTFKPGSGSSGSVTVSGLRPNASGELTAQSVGQSDSPTMDLN